MNKIIPQPNKAFCQIQNEVNLLKTLTDSMEIMFDNIDHRETLNDLLVIFNRQLIKSTDKIQKLLIRELNE